MAKKRTQRIDLSNLDISYVESNTLCRLKWFDLKNMKVEMDLYEGEKRLRSCELVFAHLPKSIKKVLNPLKAANRG